MTILPRPDVSVKQTEAYGKHETSISISRDNKSAVYEGSGSNPAEATGKAVKALIDDHKSAEWLP